MSKVKLATVVKGDLKAPFSKATTPRCKGEHYSFPWIALAQSAGAVEDTDCTSAEG